MAAAELQDELAAVAADIEHAAVGAEIVLAHAGAGLVARERRGDAHPRPRLRVVLGGGIQAAAIVEQLVQARVAGEAPCVPDQRREEIGEIVEGEAGEVELGLQQRSEEHTSELQSLAY